MPLYALWGTWLKRGTFTMPPNNPVHLNALRSGTEKTDPVALKVGFRFNCSVINDRGGV